MPITAEENLLLLEALDSLDLVDSAATARIIYDTFLGATKLTPGNPAGLTFQAITSIGRLVFEKAPWEKIVDVEKVFSESLGSDHPIRLPIIKAVDTIFRARFPKELPRLPEDKKQGVAFLLTKMDTSELLALAVLVYEIIRDAPFTMDPATFAATGIHPFSKFLSIAWTWRDLFENEPSRAGICLPIVTACHDSFREKLPFIFKTEELPTDESVPTEETAADPEAPPITPEEEAVAAAAAEVETPEAEGGASDLEPFAPEPPAEEEEKIEAQGEEPHADAEPEAAPAPEAEPHAMEHQNAPKGDVVVVMDATQAQPSPSNEETTPQENGEEKEPEQEGHDAATNGNGHRLSKKERREMRKRQKDQAQG